MTFVLAELIIRSERNSRRITYMDKLQGTNGRPVEGIFIPGENLNLIVTARKRKEVFLCIYPEIQELTGEQIRTFLCLLQFSDYYNRFYGNQKKIFELLSHLNLRSVRAAEKRIQSLRPKAIIGRVPLLFLNPFYGSKCRSGLLKKLREEWMVEQDLLAKEECNG